MQLTPRGLVAKMEFNILCALLRYGAQRLRVRVMSKPASGAAFYVLRTFSHVSQIRDA